MRMKTTYKKMPILSCFFDKKCQIALMIPFCLQAFESSQQTVSCFEYKEMANQACV